MKSTLRLLGLLMLVWCATAAGQINPLAAEYGKAPNHLEPISPELDAYDKLLQQRLLPINGDYGTFVFRPSFSGEKAVSVYGADYPKDDSREPGSYRITVTEAAKNLYYAMSADKESGQTKPVEVTRVDVTIDRELAVAIQRAWASMILQTRYPAKSYRGLDGETAQFSVFVLGVGRIHGQTWSPEKGLPKEFVDLGFAVADYASADPKDRPALRVKLIGQLRNFERRTREK